MTESPSANPGFLAVSSTPGRTIRGDLQQLVRAAGGTGAVVRSDRQLTTWVWGLSPVDTGPGGSAATYELSRGPRHGNKDVSGALLGALMTDDVTGLAEVLPPFAALTVRPGVATAATDVLGARHLYSTSGDGWVAGSTSPHVLAKLSSAPLDREALAVQSLLGWQLGLRTWYSGVSKVDRGSTVTLADGHLVEERYDRRGRPPPRRLDEAVGDAVAFLRGYLEAYLDDHPDAILQLTGGLDSRILLSAIAPLRRRRLTVMTLSVPGNEDVAIAAQLARREAMEHRVVTLDGLEALDPADVHERCVSAARKLGCMADPLALASLSFAETKIEQRPRISGLGGEVARGFYYLGPATSMHVSRRATNVLAGWRMFANQAVDLAALDQDFAGWARRFTLDEVYALLCSTGLDWMSATDEFYLYQRMQRWAGVTDTAVCFDREIVNPMLDRQFLDIALGLVPKDKRNARFLSRLQLALDADLAAIPLDGRPAPKVFARSSLANSATLMSLVGRKIARKSRQRLRHVSTPPVGGQVLASKVVQHWRAEPQILDSIRSVGVVRPDWIDQVLGGLVEPEPATVAFLVNLVVAEADRKPCLADIVEIP